MTDVASPTVVVRVPLEARRHAFVGDVARALRHRCGVTGGVTGGLTGGETGGETGGGPLIVGVSGGADSVALLLACVVLRDRADDDAPRLTPIAVHVHHHLRGAGADEDAAFVETLCARHGVPLHIEHVEPAELPGNLAANARALRYEALGRVARSTGADNIAVAHHADDQLETILIALCRGGSLAALGGMRWTRPLEDDEPDVRLIRPLLDRRRTACEAFCRAAGVTWRVDPGNAAPDRVRGRLRRDVLPVLETLWPDAPARATAAADAIETARAALEDAVARVFGTPAERRWPRAALADLPGPLVAAGLRRAALDAAPRAGDDLGQRHLTLAAELIRAADGRPRRLDWPGGLTLEVRTEMVELLSRSDS